MIYYLWILVIFYLMDSFYDTKNICSRKWRGYSPTVTPQVLPPKLKQIPCSLQYLICQIEGGYFLVSCNSIMAWANFHEIIGCAAPLDDQKGECYNRHLSCCCQHAIKTLKTTMHQENV